MYLQQQSFNRHSENFSSSDLHHSDLVLCHVKYFSIRKGTS